MSCEKYKSALIEAAADGAELTPELRSHVATCPSCAAELADQRSLVASIDANLHRQMNAPVPAAMLQRFEAQLVQQPRPKRTLRLTQIVAGTIGMLAAAAIVLVFLSRWKTDTLEPNAKPIASSAHSVSAGEIQVHIGPSAGPPTTIVARPQTPAQTQARTVLVSAAVSRTEPEVIVPPDERIAMEHFIADLHGTGEVVLAFTKRVPEQREQNVVPVVTPDIQIASLTVSPIRDTDVSTISSTNR
jgi:anti-sigma factor RsiW